DLPWRPHGVAALSNGKWFHLNDADEFKAFWKQLHNEIEPLGLAILLARYYHQRPYLKRNQSLIGQTEDILVHFSENEVESLTEFTQPLLAENSEGGFRLDFCTEYIQRASPLAAYRVGLNRWHLESDDDGQLEWTVKPIARSLRSKFYSPE